ncbi:MAG: D-beta-D-heptose 7-phosphate kinase / D-beta-D-heptose 1-phosphate adenosyltransferase [Parcubacteria group bacterium Gr01-1014_72]|nr:MAG: D-beta-D-heptose 7-phosphate kinase / D-beta-D-heptose 1-phosphate adenosyltransferase [Parcubacteria group bacterium Gr01-1014_72]
MQKSHEKILHLDTLVAWREALRREGKRLVVTNGCFDLLHAGHIAYLEEARSLGDALLVGVNGDEAVLALKGKGRPINAENDRAIIIGGLVAVDAVCVFPETTATNFLRVALPDFYVKGGDYTIETLNGEERAVVEECGGKIVILPFIPKRSTTGIVEKIRTMFHGEKS